MTKAEIIAELRRSAREDARPFSNRIFCLLVACALEDE